MSPKSVARAGGAHYLFVSTVQSLLCATRPLTYSLHNLCEALKNLDGDQ